MPVSKLPTSAPSAPSADNAEKTLLDYATLGLENGRADKVALPDASPDQVLAYRAGVYFAPTLVARFTLAKKGRGKSIRLNTDCNGYRIVFSGKALESIRCEFL